MQDVHAYIRGVYEAWKGEVMGEAFFSELAQIDEKTSMASKWKTLAELERVTGQVLAPLVRRYGILPEPSADMKTQGEQQARGVSTMPYDEFMASMEPYIEEAVSRYQALRDDALSEDTSAIQYLVDHEEALLHFVRVERSETGEDSMRDVRDVIARASDVAPPQETDRLVAAHAHSPFAVVTGKAEGKRMRRP